MTLNQALLTMLTALFILAPCALDAQIKKRLSTTVHTVAPKTDSKQSSKNDQEVSNAALTKAGPAEYPYLTTTFYFRNREKFNDKKFIKKILNLKYFYVEAAFGYQTLDNKNIEIKAPLFIVERERGKYSSSLFEDITLVNKVPYNLYGSSIPSVSCYTKRVSKNKLSLISELTSLYKPLIGADPFSSLASITNFVDDVVKKLAVDQTLEVRASFPTFSVRDLEIIPFSYKVLIYHPEAQSYSADELVVVEDSSGYLSVETKKDNAKLDTPYIIVQTGLSNYVALGGLPSEVLDEFLICTPSNAQIAELKVFLNSHEHVLSPSQLRNEQYLISLLEQVALINDGLVGERDSKTDKIIQAYDAYYDRTNLSQKTGSLYEKHYKPIVESLFRCYNTSGLTYSITCDDLIRQINTRELNYASLKGLINNIYVLDNDRSKSMPKTKIYRIATAHRSNYEQRLYMEEFSKLILNLSDQLDQGTATEAKNYYQDLTTRLNEYLLCSKCWSEAESVKKKYLKKLSDEIALTSKKDLAEKEKAETDANNLLKRIDTNSAMVLSKLPGNDQLRDTNAELVNSASQLRENLVTVQQLKIPQPGTEEKSRFDKLMDELKKSIESTMKTFDKVNKAL